MAPRHFPNDRIRVLVADDSEPMREALVLLLEAHGRLEVVGTAVDGLDAIAAAAQLQPDVVVMDMRMPRLDGIEATRRITRRADAPRVVMLSADTDQATRDAAIAAGVERYVAKDAPRGELVDAVLELAPAAA